MYIERKRCNPGILKTAKSVEFWMGSKILLFAYELDVGITLKHPQTINGNVKNLSKMIENEK